MTGLDFDSFTEIEVVENVEGPDTEPGNIVLTFWNKMDGSMFFSGKGKQVFWSVFTITRSSLPHSHGSTNHFAMLDFLLLFLTSCFLQTIIHLPFWIPGHVACFSWIPWIIRFPCLDYYFKAWGMLFCIHLPCVVITFVQPVFFFLIRQSTPQNVY